MVVQISDRSTAAQFVSVILNGECLHRDTEEELRDISTTVYDPEGGLDNQFIKQEYVEVCQNPNCQAEYDEYEGEWLYV